MARYLVTGASTGIGAAAVRKLDGEGHNVFAGLRDLADADGIGHVSARVRPIVLDVTSDSSIAAAAAEIEESVGAQGLDGLVNNAGTGVPGPLETLDLDDLRHQLEVNLVGQVAVTQAMLPLVRRARGRIVFIGSVGGIVATPFAGAYHASKFGIEAIGDVWRQELAPDGIAVIVVEPPAISTPIWAKTVEQLDDLRRRDGAALERYGERLDAFRSSLESADKRGMSPNDVAAVIAKALTARRPRTRYAVGVAGKIATALRPLLPDRVVDRLAARTAKR